MPYVRRKDLGFDDLEVMWIEIKAPNSRPWLVGIVYRTPSSSADFFSKFERNVEHAFGISNNLILIGDFNCNVLTANPLLAKLQSLCSIFNLEQLIQGPTRVATFFFPPQFRTPSTFYPSDFNYFIIWVSPLTE